MEVQPREHPGLELRRVGGVGADGAGYRPDGGLDERARKTLRVAVRLEGEAREFDPEGGRLGVDAVGAADAERVAVLAGSGGERADEMTSASEDDARGGSQLQRQRRVEDVAGGEAIVKP